MKNIDEMVCTNCLDIVLGPHRSKSAEYFNINSKPYCSLSCYYEDFEKVKDDYKSVPPKETITMKLKIGKVTKGKPLKYKKKTKRKK